VNISEDPHYHVLTERAGRVTTAVPTGVDLTV
jgi:hypothetical protein